MASSGKYIVIEGTDGTGKSTQVDLLAERLKSQGIPSVTFHEPDGVPIASEVRLIIKNGSLDRSALTNLLLFSACRRENWFQIGKQALAAGTWVLSARDYTSTLVYQGLAEGLDLNLIEQITLQATDERYVQPDHRIILDILDETERERRIKERGKLKNPDTFESRDEDFQQQILAGYRKIATDKDIPIVSAIGTPEQISDEIWALVGDTLA
ncbi:MAG TPA: dTMP kinase [Candidatus Saccharibacteria bacterium]|nr:dTMP kinase [Candidatus Saccharibacteria bacterium]